MSKRNRKKQPGAVNKTTPVIQQITVRPFNRQSTDITSWRNSTRSAEAQVPRRVYLYDLYHDIRTTDGQVISVWQKRIDPITSANWEFTDKDGNPVDEINEMIDCIGFEELLTEIIDSKGWGYSMCEPTFFINDNDQNEFSLYSVPKKHMRPETGIIALEQAGDIGINIREGIYSKTVMEFGKPNDLGLFLSAAMYSIYKRGSTADWAEFIEIFGRGIIDAEWDGFDESQRNNLAKAIHEMGAGGVIIRPAGTKVEIKNNTGSANGQLQDTFVSKMDAYISKVLLGTTETTDSSRSSGYAQAEIHNQQDEKKNETDLAYVRRNLNSRFIKVLKAAGFDTRGGTFVLKQEKKTDKQAFEIHKSMRKELNVPIDDDFFYENYGVRKPDNYDALKEELQNSLYNTENKESNVNEENETARTPSTSKQRKDKNRDDVEEENKQKLSFFRRLIRLFHNAPTAMETLAVGAVQTCCSDHHTIKLAAYEELNFEAFARKAWEAKGNMFLYTDLFDHYAEVLLESFESGWNTKSVQLADLGFEYGYTDPKIQTAWEMNLFKFSAIRASYQSAEVNAIYRKSKNFDEFYRTLKKTYGVEDKRHLETEWNTANAAGESASTYYRLLGQTKIFKYWKYMTQADGRVRVGHEKLHGCIFKWDDPIWDIIMPPNGWNCRCFIVPMTEAEVTEADLTRSKKVMEELYNSEAWVLFEKSGFNYNMANTKEVFSQSHQYSKTPEKVLDNVGKMYYDDWGLKPILDRQADFKNEYELDQERKIITDFFDKYKVSNRKAVIKDFKGREIVFEKSRLLSHTNPDKGDYANRHQYLTGLEQAIQSPDEVWINNDKTQSFDSYVYIKYYKNVIIKVICNIDEQGNLQIKTWYNIEFKNTGSKNREQVNDLYRHRRGLLIKK